MASRTHIGGRVGEGNAGCPRETGATTGRGPRRRAVAGGYAPAMAARWLDVLVDSALWVALAAAALAAAAGRALEVAYPPALPGLAFCGTLVVYVVDRVRDVERDRATSPERTAFVARHRGALLVAVGVAAGAALVLAWRVPAATLLPPAAVLPLAFLHRRLKGLGAGKPVYVTAAWVAIVVGMPAMLPGARHAAWVAGGLGLAILANAIASNVRDREAGAARYGVRTALAAGRAAAALALVVLLAAPAPVRPLAVVAALTLASLLAFRAGERYGLVVVDGALLVGALLSLGVGGAVGA